MTAYPTQAPPDPRAECPQVTRRSFLAGLGASVAVATAGGYGISVWGASPAVAALAPAARAATRSGRTLVVIEMGGGNDGLNTVVPHADGRYHDLRSGLAVDDPLDLDGTVGFHPALGYLAQRYRAGEVAIVEGIGYPDPDLSHFASMSTWWSGTADDAMAGTGWIGRHLDRVVADDDPLAGIVIGPGPSPAMLGARAFTVVVQDLTGLTPTLPPWIDEPAELRGLWSGFAPAAFDGAVLLDQVRVAIGRTVSAADRLDEALEPARHGAGDGLPDEDRARRRGSLEQYLEVAAALATAPAPPRVIFVHGWGDFDTHQGQANRHAEMMTQLDEGLADFFDAVVAAGRADDVVVMTTSEFGRRPASNGSGTDHGTASSHLVVGRAVTGGRYGEPVDLARLDARGNPTHTVDVGSYYATTLAGWLDDDPAEVLGRPHEGLDFLAPPMRTPWGPL